MRIKVISVIILVLTVVGFRLRRAPEVTKSSQDAPLAIANKVIPDLMGTLGHKNRSSSSPEEIARKQEIQQFRNYLQTSYVRLPTIETLRLSKEGDFHRLPPDVLESSEIFGAIADKLKTNTSLTKDALGFYNACAANEQLLTSIRAVCARNLIDLAKKAQIDISRTEIPEKILQIANVLPSKS